MKKVLKILTAAVLSVTFVGSAASAATCNGSFTITGTGSNSNNTISCTDINNVTATCVNNVVVLNFNDQNGVSGSGTVSGNTSGGSAVSGTVTNTNGSTVDLATVCGASASPSPSVTPVTPGGGSVTPPAAKPAALPYTAGNSSLAIVMGSLAAAAAVVAVSRLAVAAYRHFSVK